MKIRIAPEGAKPPSQPDTRPPQTIDITPTWSAILPLLLAAYEGGTFEGKHAAESELRRMAKLADAYVAERKGKDDV